MSKIRSDPLGRDVPHGEAAWSFDACVLPVGQRTAAWAEALRRLHLPFAEPGAGVGAEGTVVARFSPMGFDFALVSGGPQSIAGRVPGAVPGLWLGLLIEGEAYLKTSSSEYRLDQATIMYGATGVDAALNFSSHFRQLFVRIPSVAIDARLLTPLASRVAAIPTETIGSHGLLALLRSVATSLEEGRSGELAPLDSALVELLVPLLAAAEGTAGRGGTSGLRARQFERVCRMLETHLGDPQLTVRTAAAIEGVSVRYLQQLFARSGQTVSGYIRGRRLERARAELESPLHSQLSITEIGFRWGFSQSAHFSRAYRERFDESPRETRRKAREALRAD